MRRQHAYVKCDCEWRRGGESTTLGSEGKHQAGYAKAKAKNAVEAYTLLPQRCMSEGRRKGMTM